MPFIRSGKGEGAARGRTILILRRAGVLLAFLPIAVVFARGTDGAIGYTYRVTFGGATELLTYTQSPDAHGYTIRCRGDRGSQVITCDPRYNTKSYTQYAAQTPEFTVSRKDRTLSIQSTRDGRVSTTRLELPCTIWYANPFLYRGFVDQGITTSEFALVNPADRSVMKFKFIRQQRERIRHNGAMVEVVKVKMVLPDWRERFWASYFWFRASDGVLVKSEELRGPPGSRKYFTELVAEAPGEPFPVR